MTPGSDVIASDVIDDAKRGTCVGTSDASVQVSLGAANPSNGPADRPAVVPTGCVPTIDLANPIMLGVDGLSKNYLTSPVKTGKLVFFFLCKLWIESMGGGIKGVGNGIFLLLAESLFLWYLWLPTGDRFYRQVSSIAWMQ